MNYMYKILIVKTWFNYVYKFLNSNQRSISVILQNKKEDIYIYIYIGMEKDRKHDQSIQKWCVVLDKIFADNEKFSHKFCLSLGVN